LSLPDQERQLREYASRKGLTVVKVYEERGASARDDRRPVFQELVADALDKQRPFDVVLVLTTSRFFREATLARIYKRKLRKHGVRVVATAQETSDDPMGEFVEGIFELIDQHESTMNSYHTTRALCENARRGFLNGRPKYGFKAEVVTDENGNRKKRPVINTAEATTVRRMFDLASSGMGALKLAEQINREGHVRRTGKAWTKQSVLDHLGDPAFKGAYIYHRKDHKRGCLRPRDEWITINVDPIVAPEQWDRVAAILESRSPKIANPSVVSSPMLLTGLLVCGKCGAKMTLESGKSGKYRYYQCRKRLREGKDKCAGTRIRVEHLEDSLLNHLRFELFKPERVRKMLEGLCHSMTAWAAETKERRKAIKAERRGIEGRLQRQYEAIEEGLVEKGDVGERIRELKARLVELDAQLYKLPDADATQPINISDEAIDQFTDRLEDLLLSGDRSFAKRYLQLLLEKVVVDGKIIHVHAKAAGVAQVFSAIEN
jgi:site-specific DNA recombinase